MATESPEHDIPGSAQPRNDRSGEHVLQGCRKSSEGAGQAPAATGRPSAHHCEYEPGYRASSSPASSPARINWQAVMPDPQEAATVAAVAPTPTPAPTPMAPKAAINSVGRPERAVSGEQVGDRQVHRAGDVPGNRVERLDLAAESGRRPGRPRAPRTRTQPVRRPRRPRRPASRPGATVTVPGSSGSAGRPRAAGRPTVQAASPPSSTRTSGRPDQRSSHQARADASPLPPSYTTTVESSSMPAARQRRLQIGRVRQRVPAAIPGCAGQIPIEVDEDRAGDVRGEKGSSVAAGQRPAHVEQHRSSTRLGLLAQHCRPARTPVISGLSAMGDYCGVPAGRHVPSRSRGRARTSGALAFGAAATPAVPGTITRAKKGTASVNDLIDTTEMYLRTIFELEEEGIVPLRARIAERLNQSGPTVSQTVARMQRDGLLVVSDDRHLELTDLGRDRAIAVMRKHRLAERLLAGRHRARLAGRARRGLPLGTRDERAGGAAADRAAGTSADLAVRQPDSRAGRPRRIGPADHRNPPRPDRRRRGRRPRWPVRGPPDHRDRAEPAAGDGSAASRRGCSRRRPGVRCSRAMRWSSSTGSPPPNCHRTSRTAFTCDRPPETSART